MVEGADRGVQPPDDEAAEDLRRLVEACLARMEEEGSAALDALCEAHPDQAERLRRRIQRLRKAGLLDTDAEGPEGSEEERIPERLGDFHLIRKLGKGGMGVVYLARQESLEREVALKLIRPERLYFPGARERFRREVEAIARLSHPGIVPVYVVGEEEGLPYFAMECVRGASLEDVLARLRGRDPAKLSGADLAAAVEETAGGAVPRTATGQLPHAFRGTWVEIAFRMIRSAAEAVHHAHQMGVLHRDLKPSNVMIALDGRALVLDFGLASTSGVERMTQPGTLLGSIPFMAPEQLDGEAADLDPRTDVYALGVTLYEWLTLRHPFGDLGANALREAIRSGRSRPLVLANPLVPRDAQVVCQTAMERDRQRRYPDAAAFAADLTNFLERRPIHARPIGFALRTRRLVQRHPALSASAVLLAVILFGGPLLFAWQQRGFALRERAASEELGEALETSRRHERNATSYLRGTLSAFGSIVDSFLERRVFSLPEFEPVTDVFLREMLRIHEQFLESEPDDLALRTEIARARHRVGTILGLLGRREEARDALERGLELIRGVLAERREPAPELVEASLLGSLGDVRLEERDRDGALEAFRESTRILRALRHRIDGPGSRWVVHRNLHGAGERLMRVGLLEPARTLLEEAVEVLEESETRRTDDQIALGHLRTAIGNLHRQAGRSSDALAQYERAAEELRAIEPSEDVLAARATTLVNLVNTLLMADRIDLALTYGEEALAVAEAYRAARPGHPDRERAVANQAVNLADVYISLERFAEARTQLARALDVFEQLVRRYPREGQFALQYATTLGTQARLCGSAGWMEEARTWFAKTRDELARIRTAFPAELDAWRHTVTCCTAWAHYEELHGERAAVLERLEEAVAAACAGRERSAQDALLDSVAQVACLRLARERLRLGRRESALDALEQALVFRVPAEYLDVEEFADLRATPRHAELLERARRR